MTSEKADKKIYNFFVFSILITFILRIYLSQYFTLYNDLNIFIGWGEKISRVGFSNFYSTYWSDYMPGYLYILRLLNEIHSIFPGISKEILYKLPANISDLIITTLIYINLRKYVSDYKAYIASMIYFLNPAVLANSTFWGQIDSLHALPIVISCLFALKQRYILSGIFITISFFIKPQTIIVFPFIALLNFIPYLTVEINRIKVIRSAGLFILSILLVSVVIVFPFIFNDINNFTDIFVKPISFTIERFHGSYDQYKYASLNAFNFWGTFALWESDQIKFLGLTYQRWGTLIFLTIYLIIFVHLFTFLKKKYSDYSKNKFYNLFEALTIIFLVAFLFLTRVHERHLLTTIVLFSFFAIRSRSLLYQYSIISLVYLINLIYAFGKLTTFKKEFTQNYFTPIIFLLSTILILLLVFLIIDFYKNTGLKNRLLLWVNCEFLKFRSFFTPKKLVFVILFLLFLLSFGFKVDKIGQPTRHYFDENFFAFTAQEMAKGNPLGWQKGERAPGKIEYEWTHPPLGKEITALGIILFGDKSSSWRIMQAIIGALGTIFIFFLARNLFNSSGAGIFASFLYTFESIIFVFSRIAHVDIYLLNFIILASLFFVNFTRTNRYLYLFLSALFAGAAMSVKWSGAFVVCTLCFLSLLVVYYRCFNNKTDFISTFYSLNKVVLIFLFIPIFVYLASYIPYFLNGNSFSDFISFQETMFNYHKNVSKLHAYRSEWWSWPFMIRPVCLYIEKFGKYREYIYSLGNPVIWWSGLLAMIVSLIYSIKYRYYPLMFVVISFFAYILPWAISPRKITYIYHYIPSLLFVILALSFFLEKIWRLSSKARIFVVYFIICVVVAFLFFHPVLSGERIPKSDLKSYRWMKSWI